MPGNSGREVKRPGRGRAGWRWEPVLGEEALDQRAEGEEQVEAAVLPLRDVVVFPRMVTPLRVGRDKSLRAVEAAVQREEPLVVLTQRAEEVEDPTPEDLYTVGTLVSVARVLRMPDGTTSVLVQGQQRAQVVEFLQQEPYLRARVRLIFERTDRPPATEALMRGRPLPVRAGGAAGPVGAGGRLCLRHEH
jgi:ATP-dependent Lon protease